MTSKSDLLKARVRIGLWRTRARHSDLKSKGEVSKDAAIAYFVSVIIPAFNSADTLGMTLSSLLSSDFPKGKYEVIVIDNCSQDSTVEIAKNFPVKTIICGKPGAAAAMNKGIAIAKGDIICITESDCIVPPDWLRGMVSHFSQHHDLSAVGGQVIPYSPDSKLEKLNGEIYMEDQVFPERREETKYLEVAGCLYNANSAYRREALQFAKGFDERLLGFYDVDLCWRLVANGRKLVFDPNMKLFHVFPRTLKGIAKQYFKWGKGYAVLRKKYSKDFFESETLKQKLFLYYDFLKTFLQLLFSKSKEKCMVKFFARIAYILGRLAGCKVCM